MKDQLEAEIFANPDSQEAYLAYGDLLATENDPRGEMIGVGRELAKNPTHKAMLKRHAELVPLVLGPLAAYQDLMTEVVWHMGFIKSVKLAYTNDRFNEPTPVVLAEVLAMLFGGAGRFLQHLTVGVVKQDDPNYGEIAKVIGNYPRALRSLFLGDFTMEECELNWASMQDLSPIWPMCQELRSVTLRAGTTDCGPISLPKCTSFETITGGADDASMKHIAAADWPELVRLSLQIGTEGDAKIASLAPIFAAERVPKLKNLGVKNTSHGDEVIAALAESNVLAQLEELDISMSTIEDEGFELLEEHRAKFEHVKLTLGGEDTEERTIPELTIRWEERYGPVFE